jgi:formylglycine-generating enzyme required for sulfatase activity
MGLLSLACSGPGDKSGQDVVDVYGVHIPDEILGSFRSISGGNLNYIGTPAGTSTGGSADVEAEATLIYADEGRIIDSQTAWTTDVTETGDAKGDSVRVNSFAIMDSEVTIEMYVDFLNRIAPTQYSGGEGSSSSTSGITFSDASSTLYKSVMQQVNVCGIYPRSSDGAKISDPYNEYAGFYLTTSNKPNGDYTDPNLEYQKPRMLSSGSAAKFGIEPGRKNYPVVFVSQSDAKEFCQWLGPSYRLPTWQEWSYAAKGGKEVNFATSTGGILKRDSAGAIMTPYIYLANIMGNHTSSLGSLPIKSFAPNSFGLYDMTGNVYEWTYFREEDHASNGATLPYNGSKFYMGGSYRTLNYSSASNWYRTPIVAAPGVWASDAGFRVVYDHSRALSLGEYSNLVAE